VSLQLDGEVAVGFVVVGNVVVLAKAFELKLLVVHFPVQAAHFAHEHLVALHF